MLYTDASDKVIGAILVQKDDQENEQVISYVYHKLSGAQLHWPTIEKEAYGIIYALKKLHPYPDQESCYCTASLHRQNCGKIWHAFENCLQEFGIRHHLTSSYHSQSKKITKRFNCTIQKLLLKLTGENEQKWSTFLAQTLYEHQITAGPTGISSYQAIYGQRARLS